MAEEARATHGRRLRHAHILALYGGFETPKSVVFVLQIAPKGDLFSAMQESPGGCFTEQCAAPEKPL